MTINYELAENETLSYGSWRCPKCGNEFYGGGEALHKTGCSKTGYEGLTYRYTQKELDCWNEEVLERGFCANLPVSPVGLSSYLLREAIAAGEITSDFVRQVTEKYVVSVDATYLPKILEQLEELLSAV